MKATIKVMYVRANAARSLSVEVPAGLTGKQLTNWRRNAAPVLDSLPTGAQVPAVDVTASVDDTEAAEGDSFGRR